MLLYQCPNLNFNEFLPEKAFRVIGVDGCFFIPLL
jgi:hypothetical protein